MKEEDIITILFGQGTSLNAWQMLGRAIVVFIFTLVLIRIAGRRSFGLRAPFDNVILILLGAILGRAVIGVSPLFSTLFAGLIICILHRLLAWASLKSAFIEQIAKGAKRILYKNGHFVKENLKSSLVNEEDLKEELRLRALVDSFDKVDAIYMERNGEISTVKKCGKNSSH